MNLKPSQLFLFSTVLSVALALLLRNYSMDVYLHNAFYVVSGSIVFMAIASFVGITALLYLGVTFLFSPVNNKIGFWHFGFTIVGILLLLGHPLIFNSSIRTYSLHPHSFNWAGMMLLGGGFFLCFGFLIFIYGIFSSMRKPDMASR
ncbi:hypothetical protein ABIB40_003264 [Pedobacter sp. UYP30]|uniref:hypothetical protein n=1 Tax=Pedobacter sp. UYP30 TaxID=1756400 RepID=UPI003397BF8D